MKILFEKNKYALSQVILLIIFALGLMLSGLIVLNRKRVVFSEPIRMPADGVSVSLPHGNGWQSSMKWKHNPFNNSIGVQSWLNVGQTRKRSIGVAKFQYLVAPEGVGFKQALQESLKELRIIKYRPGKMVQDGLDVEWAEVTTENRMTDYYFGRSILPSGRVLQLEVLTPGNADLANKVFSAVIKKLRYSPDNRITAGEYFVNRFKKSGVTAGLNKETSGNLRRVYMVSRFNNRFRRFNKGTGFLVENFMKDENPKDIDSVKALTLYFLNGQRGLSGSGLFESDDGLEDFHMKTKTIASTGEPLRRIELEYKEGILHRFNLRTNGRQQGEEKFVPSDSAVPELFLDCMLRDYIDNGSELVIDIIYSDGRVVPAVLTLINTDERLLKVESAEYAVRFDIMDGNDSIYELYLDSEKQIISKIEKTGKEIYLLEKTEVPVLLQRFSNWRNDIKGVFKR